MEKRIERMCVRHAKFPDTTNGFIGFYEFVKSDRAIEPHIKVIKNAEQGRTFVQINTPEKMDEVAQKVGAKTRKEFQKEMGGKAWVKAYAKYLSNQIGEFLEAVEEPGSGLIINVTDGNEIDEWIELWCPRGEFVYR